MSVTVKCHQLLNPSSDHHGAYSYQVTSISEQYFLKICADRHTYEMDAQTPPNQYLLAAGEQVTNTTEYYYSNNKSSM